MSAFTPLQLNEFKLCKNAAQIKTPSDILFVDCDYANMYRIDMHIQLIDDNWRTVYKQLGMPPTTVSSLHILYDEEFSSIQAIAKAMTAITGHDVKWNYMEKYWQARIGDLLIDNPIIDNTSKVQLRHTTSGWYWAYITDLFKHVDAEETYPTRQAAIDAVNDYLYARHQGKAVIVPTESDMQLI